MVGLDAAGKTTILYKLKLGEIVTTIPTIGQFFSSFHFFLLSVAWIERFCIYDLCGFFLFFNSCVDLIACCKSGFGFWFMWLDSDLCEWDVAGEMEYEKMNGDIIEFAKGWWLFCWFVWYMYIRCLWFAKRESWSLCLNEFKKTEFMNWTLT